VDLDEKQQGIKVQLGDKTLRALLNVQVADTNDISWKSEYDRRIRAGETKEQILADPPFGRQQHTTTKRMDIGEVNIDEKLDALQTAVEKGQIDLTLLGTSLSLMLDEIRDLSNFQLQRIKELTKKLNIPRTPGEAGLKRQIYSKRQFEDNRAQILLFLLSTGTENYTSEKFVNVFDDEGNDAGYCSLKLLSRQIRGNYLDIANRALIPLKVARESVEAGIDNGELDDGRQPTRGDANLQAARPPSQPASQKVVEEVDEFFRKRKKEKKNGIHCKSNDESTCPHRRSCISTTCS
jgi:hypothetical protein